MDIIVTPDPADRQRGSLKFGVHVYGCVLGRSGVSAYKQEGDGATPSGRFPLRRLLYRADRVDQPRTCLSARAIAPNAGWCDAPHDPAYNTEVVLPYPASAENLWRDDGLYDAIVVIGHNDSPVVAGAGSAIFLHVAPSSGEPTAGCVALPRSALLELLCMIDPTTAIAICPEA